ncbi:acyltransferase family protein [Coralliovum pocilloporae]|uniref:acyltransferase family protein n=1 Tax=Coralliovum pocilloporae TaxID=3066369 RepID=UPI003306F56A
MSIASPSRVAWVDYAKGFCIILVVMMHSTLGVGKAAGEEGWMHHVVAFAAPFRMPDFFLISGLFLARVIDRDWRTYLDKKVLHFVYFYVLWVTIQAAFKAPPVLLNEGFEAAALFYLRAFVEPFGTLWFIYLLPVFFVITKLLRSAPQLLVLAGLALLEIAPIHTGSEIIDQFAGRFVFFYAGYLFADRIFDFADWVRSHTIEALAILTAWSVVNGVFVFGGYSHLPVVSLMLGGFGAVAVISVSALLSKMNLMAPLRYLGQNSIVIYLAFFLPMAVSRIVLLKLGIISDIGTISLLVTTAGVVAPIVFFWLVQNTRFVFLFRRPDWAQLKPQMSGAKMAPAE